MLIRTIYYLLLSMYDFLCVFYCLLILLYCVLLITDILTMHALLPQPEAFSNSRMPCWSLRLSQSHARGPGKNGQHFVLLKAFQQAPLSSTTCCGGFHSRTTLPGSRYPGRTPPNVGARTPCPKAKARTGYNTRHGLPHSTCTPLTSLLANARQGRQR